MRPTPGLGMAGMLWLFPSVCRLRHSHRLAEILAPGAICQVLRRHAVLGFTGAGQYPLQIQHSFSLYATWVISPKVYAPLLGSSLDRPRTLSSLRAQSLDLHIALPTPQTTPTSASAFCAELIPHLLLLFLFFYFFKFFDVFLSLVSFSTQTFFFFFPLPFRMRHFPNSLHRSPRQACGKRISAYNTLSEHIISIEI